MIYQNNETENTQNQFLMRSENSSWGNCYARQMIGRHLSRCLFRHCSVIYAGKVEYIKTNGFLIFLSVKELIQYHLKYLMFRIHQGE
jgi:hypothetical protein